MCWDAHVCVEARVCVCMGLYAVACVCVVCVQECAGALRCARMCVCAQRCVMCTHVFAQGHCVGGACAGACVCSEAQEWAGAHVYFSVPVFARMSFYACLSECICA